MFGLVRPRFGRAFFAAIALAAVTAATGPAIAAPTIESFPPQWSRQGAALRAPVRGFLIRHTSEELRAGRLLARYAALSGLASDAAEPPRRPMRPAAASQATVMGSSPIEVGGLPQSARWRQLMNEDVASLVAPACARGEGACGAPLARRAAEQIARLSHVEDAAAVLRQVNAFVNRTLAYRDDLSLHGRADYWASLSETLRLGAGDCEEFALMKLAMLRMLGFEGAQLRLTLLRIPARNQDHAVLVENVAGVQHVLDNLAGEVYRDTQTRGYLPMVSLVEGQTFIHGVRRGPSRLAEQARRPSRL